MQTPSYRTVWTKLAALSLLLVTNSALANDHLTLLSFEHTLDNQQLKAVNGKISTTDERSKFGKRALKWQFQPNSKLVLHNEIGFKHFNPNGQNQARHNFMTWLYNDTPSNKQLEFQFLQNDQLATSFKLNLNFTGWRAISVPFEQDMLGQPNESMNKLIVVAPDIQGTLLFDLMATSIPIDPRWPTPDYQVPFVNKIIGKRANAHWGALLEYDQWQQQFEQQPHQAASSEELAAIEKIKQRVDQDILSSLISKVDKKHLSKKQRKQALNKQQKNFSSGKFALKILDKGKQLTTYQGKLKPVQMGRQLEVYKKAKINSEQLQALNEQTLRFRALAKHLLQLAKAYKVTSKPQVKKQVKQQFTTLVAHLHEQGYTRGSAVGIMHHQGYSMREWSKAIFLGRDMLSPELLAESQQAIAWLAGLGRIFRDKQDNHGFNVDVMNTFLPGMLMTIVLQKDANLQAAYLRSLSDWMSYSMLATKGLSGGIQPDGSFFHHAQHYVAYGNGGLNGLTPVVYYLSHTPFELTNSAYQRLRQGVMMTRIFSNGLKAPMSLAGRHPEKYEQITLAPFKYLTLIGDKGVANAFLRLINSDRNPTNSPDVAPEAAPNGAWVMNYSSLAIQRRDEWLATVRGFSRYLVGNESYADANHFGRYMNYGHLEILPSSKQDGGYNEDGWDWNRWPGTTTIHLPLEQLAAQIRQVDQFSGMEEMLLSTETYSGGNQLGNRNAMFAMKLTGHDKYNSDLTANKSVFFFDNRIVALGSDISNSDSAHNTETTLFQQSINDSQASFIGNKAYKKLNIEKRTQLNKDTFFIDTIGNAYFVPKGQNVLFNRERQNSLENERKKPTQGDFANLVLQHGTAPQNASYQYSILVNADLEQAQAFQNALASSAPPFEVKQQDKNAHIVFDRQTAITAYALFEVNQKLTDNLIASNDTPVMVMAEVSEQEKRLKLAVTDPDLNLYQGLDGTQYDGQGKQKEVSIYSRSWKSNQPKSKTLVLTLKGQWQGSGDNYQAEIINGGQTRVTITSVAATPVQLHLYGN